MTQINNISISKKAAEKINNIIISEKKDLMLKISVLGGGCAGFSYKFDLVNEFDDGDIIIEENGAKVIIDEVSVPYIQGSIIDYKNDLIGQSFEIKNPNATSECGCGTSFSL
tara:strand:- start:1429 stop:1764 length:336 start_codon:yes stop_codon:yes gene_type:complete